MPLLIKMLSLNMSSKHERLNSFSLFFEEAIDKGTDFCLVLTIKDQPSAKNMVGKDCFLL